MAAESIQYSGSFCSERISAHAHNDQKEAGGKRVTSFFRDNRLAQSQCTNAPVHSEIQSGPGAQLDRREQMYHALHEKIENVAITYLEFGVWKGDSLRGFFGFGSFEGLPETWEHGLFRETTKDHFDLAGHVPQFEDRRVQLVKGWFQKSLRPFLQNTSIKCPIVVHNDCDLQSSTLYVLATLDPNLKRGDVVIFDDMPRPRTNMGVFPGGQVYRHERPLVASRF